ncbi:hypothetical protein [Streptomyces fildesensis]|uniref:hypothetical protein n=1 Tax=Streptomyces fildesensis TaxID=375757 RepID=UPI0018E0231A|nr:hypothetical protein [Streptomyces fildesensis]
MNPDFQRELMPHSDTLRLIGALDVVKTKLSQAAQQWQLLDDTGRVPASPPYAELIQHAADAQILSHAVMELTTAWARSAHSTSRVGSAALTHLATAATLSAFAAPHFAETAETAFSLARSRNPTDRQYAENRMVLDHATARAYLRRTSEALRDAVKELDRYLDLHRFFPAPVPPQPSPHRL